MEKSKEKRVKNKFVSRFFFSFLSVEEGKVKKNKWKFWLQMLTLASEVWVEESWGRTEDEVVI